jgi:hydroxypyruvate isomerase
VGESRGDRSVAGSTGNGREQLERTIRANKEYVAHYHTGGVPGRHEIDDTQELKYPAIIRAILETGSTGFLGRDFMPSRGRDPLAFLGQGFRIGDV